MMASSNGIAPLHLRCVADPRQLAGIRDALRRWLASVGVGAELAADLVLVVSEAASNSIEHAYDSSAGHATVELSCRVELDMLRIEIIDQGRWRVPPTRDAGRGRGIMMMQRLADAVRISHGDDGTRVLIEHSRGNGGSHRQVCQSTG